MKDQKQGTSKTGKLVLRKGQKQEIKLPEPGKRKKDEWTGTRIKFTYLLETGGTRSNGQIRC